MKDYTAESIRNVALISHSGGGKTSLVEALLFHTGAVNRMGKVQEGNTVSDYEEEEIRRQQSLSTSVLPVEFEGRKLNLLDTPGFTDFVGEAISALHVAEGAIVLADAVAGVEVGTELLWGYCDQFKLPRFVLISKMDRENASFKRALESVHTLSSDVSFVPLQLPLGEQQEFRGVVDLLSMKARPGPGTASEEIPEGLRAAAQEARVAVVEAAAEGDDALLEKYLEGTELSPEEVLAGLKAALRSGRFVPVFLAAATQGVGAVPLMEAIVALMPSPKEGTLRGAAGPAGEEPLRADDAGPLAAYVWKTTADPFVGRLTYLRVFSGTLSSDSRVWNSGKEQEERLGPLHLMRGKEQLNAKVLHAGDIGAVAKLSATSTGDTLCDRGHALKIPMPEYPSALYSVAVHPKTQADSAKISSVLTRLSEEDPTLSWHQEGSTNQTILQGMGDQHIDVGIRRAEGKFQVGLLTEVPRVPYRETITRPGASQYRHKKQTGGAGQFAEVHMQVEPLEEGDYEFENRVFGGRISNSFMPAIDKGVRGVLKAGVLAGYPVSKVRVAVTDGKEHPVDSKAVAFETAGREAFKLAVREAGPVLLEPIVNLRITVPEANMGDVLGDLNTRRARVQGMESERGRSIVTAQVPLAEVQRYTTELRSMTGGRGFFSMEFSHYETVPPHVAEGIVAASKREAGKEEPE
jgi:elongation factor G